MGYIFDLRSRVSDRNPKFTFNLLLLPQGFEPGGELMETVFGAWKRILATPPFSDIEKLDSSKTSVAVYTDQAPGDLGLTQVGSDLMIDPLKRNRLREYLAATKLQFPRTNAPAEEIEAVELWPPEQDKVGRTGSLVAVIVKGTQPGELYQLTPTVFYPVPLVAVVATGEYWHKPIVRGIAQSMARLADEFELPGPEFRKAYEHSYPPPNVIVISDEQRTRLSNGDKPQDVVMIPQGWGVTKTSTVTFHPHPGEEPNLDTSKRAGGGCNLVEGGDGYRFNVLRCDFDCLMRRKPNSAALPIQVAGVEFCRACEEALRVQINNWKSRDLGQRPRIPLNSQRPLCDTVSWRKVSRRSLDGPIAFDFETGAHPTWSARVDFDLNLGLRLQRVELKERPGDPFNAATVIFETIGFRDLKVKFAGEQEMLLSFEDGFNNRATEPEFFELRDHDPIDPSYLAALRMTLVWEKPGHWDIEAVMSVVFKGRANDFDPGGAAEGNKIFPQLSMRCRKPKRIPETGPYAKVEWLSGSIHFVTGNVFHHGMDVHPDLHHMITGTQQVTLATDSNSSDHDNKYDWDREDLSGYLGDCLGEDIPYFGTWGGKWESGRLLADVDDPALFGAPDTIAENFAGATARAGHLFQNFPGLPHWSWLFDYVSPAPSGVKRFVAVYRAGERTPGNFDGGTDRSNKFPWPRESDQSPVWVKNSVMTVLKLGRQGAYDNVHIHPAMGSMNGRPIVPAPFCADLCIHLHVRWGVVALSGHVPDVLAYMNRPQFLGWGRSGRLDQGAHTTIGAPLVPPNQHVEIEVNSLDVNSTITYSVTAHDPERDAYQVFLEQGTGVLYTFGGLDLRDVANLAGGLRVFNPRQIGARLKAMRTLQNTDPVMLDRQVRHLFHQIYDRIRWYDQEFHHLLSPAVQQVPDKDGAPFGFENL